MKKSKVAALTFSALIATGLLSVSEYFYKFAFKRVKEVPETSADKQKYADAYWNYVDWLNHQPSQTFYLNKGTKDQLTATYLPAANQTNKSVIIAHGYKGNGETMANYAQMFHQLGYNVLLPDSRAHGESTGKYINFGWLDRLDFLDWINLLIEKTTPNAQIVLFGVSMGGATVEMISGEKLPSQVKALIADCGYSGIDDEMSYLLKRLYHLPKYPLLPMVNFINRRRLGFNLNDVSSVDQLKKNHLPIFFIHGEKDVYVPTEMVNQNYEATTAPKEKWIVKNASHAESFWVNPKNYKRHIASFLAKYLHS